MIASVFIVATALISTGGPTTTRSVPPNSACEPPPAIDRSALGRHEQAAERTVRNFDTAYRAACSKGVLRNRRLIQAGSVPPGRLFLKNAPEANVASIYQEEKNGRPGRMVLEYHFVVHGGLIVPTVDELEEAIFCAMQGATAAEQEEEGRCLPD